MLTEDRAARRIRRRATATVAAVIAVLAAVIAMAVVFVLRGGGNEKPPANPDAAGTSSASASGTSGVSGAGDTLTASSIKWADFFGLALPTSTAGPHRVDGAMASGFDRNASGAVLAAIHISYRAGSDSGPAVFVPTITNQVVGPDRDRFLNARNEEYATSKARLGAGPAGEISASFARAVRERSGPWAYRVEAYDPSVASVRILGRTVPDGAQAVFVDLAYTLRWVDGDWKLVAPLNGDWGSVATAVKDVPQGYTVIGRP